MPRTRNDAASRARLTDNNGRNKGSPSQSLQGAMPASPFKPDPRASRISTVSA